MNRRVMSARADHSPRVNRSSTLLIPTPPRGSASFAGRARKAPRMTATQRNSEGRTSEWSKSMTYWTNPGWSA